MKRLPRKYTNTTPEILILHISSILTSKCKNVCVLDNDDKKSETIWEQQNVQDCSVESTDYVPDMSVHRLRFCPLLSSSRT